MKLYTAKTLELALEEASKDLNIPVESLLYTVEEEKRTLFSKKITISISEMSDVVEYAEGYIRDVIHALGMDVSLKSLYQNDVIKVLIETNHNSLLIGRNGETLQALNELTKLAVSAKFKKKIRILLDIGEYKDKKYSRVVYGAKKLAHEVQKTHIDVKLDPMTPDERKKVHNALSSFRNIKTESVGDGKDRAIVIKYIPGNSQGKSSKSGEKTSTIKDEKTEPVEETSENN